MFSAIFLLPVFFLPIFCEPGDRSSANVIFEKLNKEISGHSALQILTYKTFTGAVNEDQNNAEELLQKLNESYSALKFKDSFGPITLLNHFNGLEVNNKSKASIVSNSLVVNYKDLANKLQVGSGSLSFEENKNLLYRLNHLANEYLQGLNKNVDGVQVIPLAYFREAQRAIKPIFYDYKMTFAVLVGHLSEEGLAGVGGLVLQTTNFKIDYYETLPSNHDCISHRYWHIEEKRFTRLAQLTKQILDVPATCSVCETRFQSSHFTLQRSQSIYFKGLHPGEGAAEI